MHRPGIYNACFFIQVGDNVSLLHYPMNYTAIGFGVMRLENISIRLAAQPAALPDCGPYFGLRGSENST